VPIDGREEVTRPGRAASFLRGGLVFVGLSPWFFPLVARHLPSGAASFIDAAFEATCHRLPARTLVLAGATMPLCSRCAGIFAGLALGALVAWPHMELRRARFLLAIASALMIADVAMQDLGLHPMWHSTRLLTGIALGYVVAAVVRAELARGVAPAAW
jgi:uncharacterized membrane protein